MLWGDTSSSDPWEECVILAAMKGSIDVHILQKSPTSN